MIPQNLIEFISQPGLPMCFGTRDANLQSSVAHAFAAKVNDDKQCISIFLPKIFLENHIDNLLHNSRIAFTIAEPVSHVTYQFKGRYILHTDCNENDMPFVFENLGAFAEFIGRTFGEPTKQILLSKNLGSFISITFQVEDIFNQTPGPGAGNKIN